MCVADVVRDDRATSRGHGKLQHELVARIPKGWPAGEMNVLSASDLAAIPQYRDLPGVPLFRAPCHIRSTGFNDVDVRRELDYAQSWDLG
jgi:hypothetical protein